MYYFNKIKLKNKDKKFVGLDEIIRQADKNKKTKHQYISPGPSNIQRSSKRRGTSKGDRAAGTIGEP